MSSRVIKSLGSAASYLRTTGCKTMAWLTEVAEEMNMYSVLCLAGGKIPWYFLALQGVTIIKKRRQVPNMISSCS